MDPKELHRLLDRPRKLRVEFYARTTGSWADLLDEETGERKLLDPVDEQRNVLETLLSLGVDQGEAMQKVTELHSPPRVVDTAQR